MWLQAAAGVAAAPLGLTQFSQPARCWAIRGAAGVVWTDPLANLLGQAVRGTEAVAVRALLAAMAARHRPTRRHLANVANYAGLITAAIGLKAREAGRIQVSALLHDIGKIAVPESILDKPGPLQQWEADLIMRHPETGAGILADCGCGLDLAGAVRHHHEWWDGRGYPEGRSGYDIPLGARIVAVADTFDTMTTPRVYRPLATLSQALGELERCAGTQFDPAIVGAFSAVLRHGAQSGAAWAQELMRRPATPTVTGRVAPLALLRRQGADADDESPTI